MTKTYRGFKKAVRKAAQPIHGKWVIGYQTPKTIVQFGSKTPVCDEKTISVCQSYCCNLENLYLHPIDAIIISDNLQKPISEFAEICHMGKEDYSKETPSLEALLKLKRDNGKCMFNDHDGKCGIYDIRPMNCRAYPLMISRTGKIYQFQACAGYAQGGKLAEGEEFEKLKTILRLNYIFGANHFDVDLKLYKKDPQKALNNALLEFAINSEEVQSISELDRIMGNLIVKTNIKRLVKQMGLDLDNLINDVESVIYDGKVIETRTLLHKGTPVKEEGLQIPSPA